MASWSFSPRFKFYIVKPDARRGRVAYSYTTLVSCQALLATDGGVGQLCRPRPEATRPGG